LPTPARRRKITGAGGGVEPSCAQRALPRLLLASPARTLGRVPAHVRLAGSTHCPPVGSLSRCRREHEHDDAVGAQGHRPRQPALLRAPRLHQRPREGIREAGPLSTGDSPAPTFLDAYDALPPRLDTLLLFPGKRGGYLNLNDWRRNAWTPAVEAAGLEPRPPYSMRHTYASFSIAAGIPLFVLARRMGTSVEQIDKHYGHLLPDAADYERDQLDTFDAKNEAFGRREDVENG
jgi:hypothetical protein